MSDANAWDIHMGRILTIPEEPVFHRGVGEELLAVACDGDLAAHRRVRDLRAIVTVEEAALVASPQRIVMGFDGSKAV